MSAVVAVVGAVTGVISIVPIFMRDATSADTLSLVATQSDGGAREYALPLTELQDGIPHSDRACAPEQIDWLEANALPLQRRYLLDMRNTASEGAMAALVDFRADATSRSAVATHVLVVCETDPSSPTVRAAALAVDDLGATARFRPQRGAGQAAPDIPVSWNLAPGETGRLEIELSAEAAAKGSLVVTALIGRDESMVAIDGTDFDLPGLWQRGETYFRVGASGLECVRADSGEPCGGADAAELAAFLEPAGSRS